MSVSGVGSANSYIYENVNKSNNRRKGAALFDHVGMTATSISHECQGSRFSANDAYNSLRMNGIFRSEIGEQYLQNRNLNDRNANLLVQAKGEVQKIENERAGLFKQSLDGKGLLGYLRGMRRRPYKKHFIH